MMRKLGQASARRSTSAQLSFISGVEQGCEPFPVVPNASLMFLANGIDVSSRITSKWEGLAGYK